jgi:PAS domain S-box-containing protein
LRARGTGIRPKTTPEDRAIRPAVTEPAPSARVREPASAAPRDADWESAADVLPLVVFSLRPDGTIEFVNRRLTEVSGHPASTLVGCGWRALVHADDLPRVTAAAVRAALGGRRFALECRFRCRGGCFVWMSAEAAPQFDAAGRIARWYGAAIEVESRKSAERALHATQVELEDSQARFHALAEAIPVMCFTADASGWIDWYNHRWYDFTRQTPEEALGWGWQAAHHPDDFLEVMRRWPLSIATGEPFEMEFRLRRHDGRYHWFLSRIEPLRDRDGNVIRWYGSNVDIDAQKRVLERTKRVAETLQDVFLPARMPSVPGLRFDAVYLPAEHDALVGGDWYDAFELPDGRIVFSIGDVAGHGLEASMSVGRLRQAIYTLAFSTTDPGTILTRVCEMLEYQEPGTIVTALVGTIDPAHREIAYASAGHPPPLVAYRNDDAARMQPLGGPPLGTGLGHTWITHRFPLRPDAVVAVFTDGMIEFSRDIVAAENRLRAAVALFVGDTAIARPARAIQQVVFDEYGARDDAALLLMQFSHVDVAALRADPQALQKAWRFHSSDAYSAHAARREIMAFLRGIAAGAEQLFACELVLGEILANTVEHAPGLVEVTIDWSARKPVVCVRDTGPGLAQFAVRLPDDPLSEDGRGMYLIHALADSVSVKQAAGYGTEIQVRLPLRRRVRETRSPVVQPGSSAT